MISVLLLPILTNLVSSELTDPLKERLGKGYYLYIITAITILAFIAWGLHERWKKYAPAAAPDILDNEQRLHLLQSLENRYLQRIGQHADKDYRINLQYSYCVKGLRSDQLLLLDRGASHDGPSHESLINLFTTHRFLLLLGDAGSGKTTSLISLAVGLLDQAKKDVHAPVPILFNLASWTEEYEVFERWMEQILYQSYGYSRKHAATAIRELQIIPLLDGLDETGKNLSTPEARMRLQQQCLAAIDRYQHRTNNPRFVICSRMRHYLDLSANSEEGISLFIKAQLRIEPITHFQVRNALNRLKDKSDVYYASGKSVRALLPLFDSNTEIQDALCNPFYYNLALHVFGIKNDHTQVHLTDNGSSFKKELVKLYIANAVVAEGKSTGYNKEDIDQWLIWLARWISNRRDDSFELTDLQPDVLKNKKLFTIGIGCLSALYICVLLGLSLGGIKGIKEGIFGGVMFFIFCSWLFSGVLLFSSSKTKIKGLSKDMKWEWQRLRSRAFWGKISGTVIPGSIGIGFIIGLVYKDFVTGLLTSLAFVTILYVAEIFSNVSPYAKWGPATIKGNKKWDWASLRKRKNWERVIGWSLISASMIALSMYCVHYPQDRDTKDLFTGSLICFLVIGILVLIAPQRVYKRIETKEIRKWKWKMIFHSNNWKNIFSYWIICSCLLGVLSWFIKLLFPSADTSILSLVVFSASVLILLQGIFSSYAAFAREFDLFLAIKDPYQRLQGSLVSNMIQNALLMSILMSLLFFAYLNVTWFSIIWTSLLLGSIWGVIFSLANSPLVEYYVLNYCLYLEKAMPFPYVKFLNHCTALQILGRDGGSFRFRHQILLEYYLELAEIQDT